MRLPILMMLLLLPGCSVFQAPSQIRGNKVDPDSLKELVIGTSTRQDASSLLGSPTTRATFDDNTWLYISEVTRPRIARVQGIEQQNVVALTFDQAGVLRRIDKLSEKDGRDVSVIARTTPSPGSEASFMQMLLGNIGKFSPGGAGSSGAGASNNQ